MTQLRFNEDRFLIPQKINYDVKHNERDKEFIDKYLKRKAKLQSDYDNKRDFKF